MFQHQWLVESVGKLVETVRGRRLLIKVSLSHAGLLASFTSVFFIFLTLFLIVITSPGKH